MITEINPIQALEAFEDGFALDDMVWYKNVDSKGTGDDDINEIIEHILHTLHRFGVRGGVVGSTEALNIEAEEEDITNTEIFLAMKEAYTLMGYLILMAMEAT